MLGNRVALALVLAGIVIAAIDLSLPRVAAALYPPGPPPPPARSPRDATDVPVIWREFRPGERNTGPGTSVRICAAALERGIGTSALVVRLCDALPQTAQRRYAFGFEGLVIRAQLPGGAILGYDLLHMEAGRPSEGALPENTIPIASVTVEHVTDVIFVFSRELPAGLPSIQVSARLAGRDFSDAVSFTPLGADFAATEMARVAASPDWARSPY